MKKSFILTILIALMTLFLISSVSAISTIVTVTIEEISYESSSCVSLKAGDGVWVWKINGVRINHYSERITSDSFPYHPQLNSMNYIYPGDQLTFVVEGPSTLTAAMAGSTYSSNCEVGGTYGGTISLPKVDRTFSWAITP